MLINFNLSLGAMGIFIREEAGIMKTLMEVKILQFSFLEISCATSRTKNSLRHFSIC